MLLGLLSGAEGCGANEEGGHLRSCHRTIWAVAAVLRRVATSGDTGSGETFYVVGVNVVVGVVKCGVTSIF